MHDASGVTSCLFVLLQLLSITDGFLSLLMDNGDVREDLRLPEGDLGKEIENKTEAGEEIMVSVAHKLV